MSAETSTRLRKVVWVCPEGSGLLCLRQHGSRAFYLPGGLADDRTDAEALSDHVAAQLGAGLVADTIRPAGSIAAPSDEDASVIIELVGYYGACERPPVPSGNIAEIQVIERSSPAQASTLTQLLMSHLEASNVIE